MIVYEYIHVAFREMVLKHPESLDGLDPVMTRIGERWEADQRQDNAKRSHGYNMVDYGEPSRLRHLSNEAAASSDSSMSEPIYSTGRLNRQSHSGQNPPPPVQPPLPSGQPTARTHPPGRSSRMHSIQSSDHYHPRPSHQ